MVRVTAADSAQTSVDAAVAAVGECPSLAAPGAPLREWTFAERYPSLMALTANDPGLRRQLRQIYTSVSAFCERHVAPHVLEFESRTREDIHYVPWELLRAACELRLFSLPFPTWLGGAGQHFLAAFIAYEVIASHCVGVANLLGVNGLAISCVLSTFDPRALRVIGELICDNERRGVPTFLSTCTTEPGAGSDVEDADELAHARIRTRARRIAGGYLLNGTKIFISNGSLAALHVVVAFTDDRHRPEDLALFLVPAETPGVVVSRHEDKLGQRICPANEIVFENAFVPDAMVCRIDGGTAFPRTGIANVLGLTRAGVGAFAAGAAEGAYRATLRAVRALTWQGQPLEQRQWVQLELAHMARRAHVARVTYLDALLAVCEAGLLRYIQGPVRLNVPRRWMSRSGVRWARDRLLDAGLTDRGLKWLAARQSSRQRDTACALGDCAKVSASDLALENCQRAIALLGKEALRHDVGIEKILRDVRLLQIYEGPNQVNMIDFAKRRVRRQFAGA